MYSTFWVNISVNTSKWHCMLLSLYPAKIHTMRWSLEWMDAHLSNVLMHECGTRSGGRSSIVLRAMQSTQEERKGLVNNVQSACPMEIGMHMTSSNVMSQTANSFVRTYSLVHFICASTVAKCPLLSRMWTSHCSEWSSTMKCSSSMHGN